MNSHFTKKKLDEKKWMNKVIEKKIKPQISGWVPFSGTSVGGYHLRCRYLSKERRIPGNFLKHSSRYYCRFRKYSSHLFFHRIFRILRSGISSPPPLHPLSFLGCQTDAGDGRGIQWTERGGPLAHLQEKTGA